MKLTIFTPAYNRAGTLPRLYESLLGQSCFDFEWLIVDDGSTDHTAELVKTFTGEGKFPVRYIYKENGGKHTAHNRALEEAAGEWFWCVDSDDLLSSDAVEKVVAAGAGLEQNVGIASYKTDMEGNRLSGTFPEGVRTSGLYALSAVYGCQGEFALTFPTGFARNFPFPVFAGERFVTESVVYDRMEKAGALLLLPEVTNICEYQPGGYSQNLSRVMKNNPTGYCLYFLQRIDMMTGIKSRLVTAGKYWCFRAICKNKSLRYEGEHKLSVAAALPLGLVFRMYYKLLRGI